MDQFLVFAVPALKGRPKFKRRYATKPNLHRNVADATSSNTRELLILKDVVIYCDGSSLGNGQDAARAAAVALLGFRNAWRAFGEYLGKATNQQAEIAAAALGLEKLTEPCSVRLFSDSRYVVETMCGRFRRKSNHEWWERLDRAAKPHRVSWNWIKGHAGHNAQEAVDLAARRLAAAGVADPVVLKEAADVMIANADRP